MKYSFYCKNCGHTFMSDNKKEVSEHRKKHKIVELRNQIPFRYCPLVPTNEKRGLFARPALAQIIFAQ